MFRQTLMVTAIAATLTACGTDSPFTIDIVTQPDQPSITQDNGSTTDQSSQNNDSNDSRHESNNDSQNNSNSDSENHTQTDSDNANDTADQNQSDSNQLDTTADAFENGSPYNIGDVVAHNGKTYQCRVAGWCSIGADAYIPGQGFAWESAWELIGDAGESTDSDPSNTEPTDSTDPVDPTKPDESNQDESDNDNPIVDPLDPTEPADPTDSTEPNDLNDQEDLTAGAGIACLPEGLFVTPNATPNYCDIYDQNGVEKMGADHPRRIIGYFTSWRHGHNDQPSYLVSDIPWDKITHINYAFAHIDSNYELSVGNVNDPNNPATGLTWENIPGAEMDHEFSYKGHFNLLNKYKKMYTDVKTLISVGGWAETGGHFGDESRAADGGFYSMTTNANGSINHAGINAFAKSAVEFIRTYGFDGVDIDYEYPSSMNDSGHPDDFPISNPLRGYLWASYMEFLRVLRAELDRAGQEDNTHYLLTIASPSSGYLLRGMEAFQAVKYLDYVNIMSYDLHGAWNKFVGPNAPLFDDGRDNELSHWNAYSTSQYDGIGYLNTDWAYHYFRGAVQAGRINIGIPYYSRGWQNVQGGTYGLWGTATPPSGYQCPEGTFGNCGHGAQGIDNLWHDLDDNGNEIHSGTNPIWHVMNLKQGIHGSYLTDYGVTDTLVGNYDYHYDATLVAPWLWNDSKKVFLSIEDEQSFATKLDWVIENGIGGVMFWEMAGDFDWDASKQEYFMGDTLTTLAHSKLSFAKPYEYSSAEISMPDVAVDVAVSVADFDVGDSNYPISPKLIITNNSTKALPGGTVFTFDVGTSTSTEIKSWSGHDISVINDASNRAGNNIAGLENDLHRVQIKLPGWQSLKPGQSIDIEMVYYLPIAMPSNWIVTINGKDYAISQQFPNKPVAFE